MKKKSSSQSAFFNLRVLIASVFCLAAVFMAMGATGIYSGSAEAQPANQAQAQPQSGAPSVVRMVGPVLRTRTCAAFLTFRNLQKLRSDGSRAIRARTREGRNQYRDLHDFSHCLRQC